MPSTPTPRDRGGAVPKIVKASSSGVVKRARRAPITVQPILREPLLMLPEPTKVMTTAEQLEDAKMKLALSDIRLKTAQNNREAMALGG